MSVQALSWALATATGSVSRKAVLLSLANCHNAHTGKCCPKVSRVAAEVDCSERTVKRALVDLEEASLIRRVRTRNGDRQGVNQYELLMDNLSSQSDNLSILQGDRMAPQEPEVDLEPRPTVEANASTVALVSTKNLAEREGGVEGHTGQVVGLAALSARDLVAHFVDEARAAEVPMPRRVIGHLARSVGELLGEGHTPAQVWAGMLRMVERRVVQPSLLPNFVTEAAIPKQPARRYGYGVQSSEIREDDPDVFGPGNPYLEER